MMFRISRSESERNADDLLVSFYKEFELSVSALMGKQVKASSPLVDSPRKASDGRADR